MMRTALVCFLIGWLLAGDPAFGHDIYQNLRDLTGMLCCGGEECGPVEVLPEVGGYYIISTGEHIPAAMVQVSPDERFHRCHFPVNKKWDRSSGRFIITPNDATADGSPSTRCFFAPVVGF